MLKKLINNPVSFLADAKPSEDIVLSSRIRLARNLKGWVFPAASTPVMRMRIVDRMDEVFGENNALGKDMLRIIPDELGEIERQFILERRLGSMDLLCRDGGTAIFCCAHERKSVMVNEEDHLRFQLISAGFNLEKLWREISLFDDKVSESLEFAYDAKLGYLTSCPTNVGSGMRASAMLHLPALVLSNSIGPIVNGIRQIGYAVRGVYGEGTDNRGNLFQISNQRTLGESEFSVIEQLDNIIGKVVASEEEARAKLVGNSESRNKLMDAIGRSYGELRYNYSLGGEDLLNLLSMIRLGVDLGALRSIDIHLVNELFISSGRAHLQYYTGVEIDNENENFVRAKFVREKLNGRITK